MKPLPENEQTRKIPEAPPPISSFQPLNLKPESAYSWRDGKINYNITPDKYISFCKENCSVDCIHTVEDEENNSFFYGNCIFYEHLLCSHNKNPDTIYRTEWTEKIRKFRAAEQAARKAAGFNNEPETYTFACPNCQTQCYSFWREVDEYPYLVGDIGCPVCEITFTA